MVRYLEMLVNAAVASRAERPVEMIGGLLTNSYDEAEITQYYFREYEDAVLEAASDAESEGESGKSNDEDILQAPMEGCVSVEECGCGGGGGAQKGEWCGM